MFKDYIAFAFTSFKARKLRTFLTALGIIIGIAAVVSLISLGQGLENSITEQFNALGADKFIVSPQGGFFGAGAPASIAKLQGDDLDVIRRTKGVLRAGGMIFKLAQVKANDETKSTFISGIPLDETRKIFEDINNFDVSEGRNLRKGDQNVAIIGIILSEKNGFFDTPLVLREKIFIEGKEFKIVGILQRIGNPTDDTQILIPLESAEDIFDSKDTFDYFMGQVRPGFSPSKVSEEVTKDLRRHRNVKEDEEDFDVQTFEQILQSFTGIFSVVQTVLIGIAGISLIVGGLGIMNTMYTSVIQRTSQIGVMKAIGARNKDIILIFLIESGFLGLAGGIIGILLGLSVGKLAEIGAAAGGVAFSADTSVTLIIGALAFSFIVGAIAGVAPAFSASKLKPVDALRYE